MTTPPVPEPAIPEPAGANARVLRWRSGLRARLFGLGVIAAIPLVLLSGYRLWEHWTHGDHMVSESVMQSTFVVKERIDQRVKTSNAMLDVLGAAIHFIGSERAHNDSLLVRTQRGAGRTYDNFYAFDAGGQLVGAARYRPRLDSLQVPVRRILDRLQSTPTMYIGIRGPSLALTDSSLVIIFARGVFDGSTLRGMVALSVRVDSLALVTDIPSILPGTIVTLFDTTGTVLARAVDGQITVPDSARTYDPALLAIPDGVTTVREGGSDGALRVRGHMRSRSAPWYVNVSVPAAAAFAPLRNELSRDLAVALIAVMSALTLAWLMGQRIVQPLNVLASDARTIARGVTDHRSRVVDRSEVGVLASAINHMADTAEKRSAALADSERRYRLLFDSNPLPMWAWDAESMEILAVNEAAIDHYGYDRDTFLSMHIIDIIDPVDHERFRNSRLPFSERRQNAGTWTHRTADGRRIEMDVVTTSSRRLGRASWLSVGIDITARREAERALAQSEDQLRQAQKMEAIGAFAGGIAHDFNNLLTGMLGYCDLALLDLDGDNPLRADIVEIRKLAVRGAELTRQILAVSRKQVVQPTVLDPNAVVRGLDRLLARLIGEHIRVETSLDDSVSRIRVDAGQLEQVLLNLAANARDAMPAGGVLRVSTRPVSADEVQTRGLDSTQGWVALVVDDNGVGMTEDVQRRIFEPFYTTKERGKGTGLGLALAYSMVDQAGGVIRVDSEVDRGSTFTLYFPIVDESLTPYSGSDHELRDLHGTETILLAEDEDAVRSIASSALQRWGYRVLSAADGTGALELSRQHEGHIDLLLTDVVMPGMNGRELATVLKRERPEMRILYASGYTDDAALLRDIRIDELPFIQKPFTTTELVQRVRDALDEKATVR